MKQEARRISGLAAVRLSGVALQVLVQLVVGRLAGPAGLGLLQLFTSWTCVLGEAVATGRPTHGMRTLAVAQDRTAPAALDKYLSRQVRAIATPWAVALALALPFALTAEEPASIIFLAIASAGSFALMRLFAEGLKALGRPGASVLVESCGPALVLLVACTGLWLLDVSFEGLTLPAALALGMFVSMAVLAGLLAASIARNCGGDSAVPSSEWDALLPLWGSGLLSILFLQMPFLWMPLYADTATMGQFALAYKLVNLVGTVLLLLAAIYGPRFARAWHDAPDTLGATLRASQLAALALYVPLALVLMGFGGSILAIFGEGFAAAEPFLWILLAGQLINAATGLPGVLLNMAGQGRQEFGCLLAAVMLACVGFLLVGPQYGAAGIAAVYSAALVFKNLASWGLALRLTRGDALLATEASV